MPRDGFLYIILLAGSDKLLQPVDMHDFHALSGGRCSARNAQRGHTHPDGMACGRATGVREGVEQNIHLVVHTQIIFKPGRFTENQL
ncbi:hypothetical protein D3C78_1155690 [compost metagenome]